MQTRIPIKPQSEHGDSMSEIRFAWLPHNIGNVRVWLERYEVLYVWQEREIIGVVGTNAEKFKVGEWVEVYESVINEQPDK